MENFIDLTLIDNSILKCRISEIIDLDGECYVVLQPIDNKHLTEQAFILKRTKVNNELYLNVIEDNEEFYDVLEYLQTHKKLSLNDNLQNESDLFQLLFADKQQKETKTK